MKHIVIKGEKRDNVGKISTRILRNSNQIPCVVYGEKENIHFFTPLSSFKNLIYTSKVYLIDIEIKNFKKIEAILQDIQFHPVSDIILHADFFKIKFENYLVMNIPIKIIGKSIGVSKGGILQIIFRKIKLKALPKNLPDNIEIDITNLDIEDTISVKDLSNDRYTIEHPKDTVIISVKASRILVKNTQNDNKVKDEKKRK